MAQCNQVSSAVAQASALETVQALFAAFGRGDIPFILEHIGDDCRWLAPGEGMTPVGGEYIGPQGVGRFFQILGESQQITLFEPREFFEKGYDVVVLGVEETRFVKTGKSVRTNWVMIFRLRDGKVHKWEQFFDSAVYAALHEAP